MKTDKFIVAKLLIILCSLLVSAAYADQYERDLKGLDGQATAIQEHVGQGKWTVVMVWASDCSVCHKTAPEIVDFHARHKDIDATVIGVALDGYAAREAVLGFIDRSALNFPNFIAEMPYFALRYETELGERLLGTPTYILFAPNGDLVANNPGPLTAEMLEKFIAKRGPDGQPLALN